MPRFIIIGLVCLVSLCLVSFTMKADSDAVAAGKKKEKLALQQASSPVDARALKRLDAKIAFEKRLMTALRKKVSVKLFRASVEEVAEVIAEHMGLAVAVDAIAFEEEGVDVTEMDINLKVADVQLITVLDLLELSNEIRWVVRGQQVVLTTFYEEELLLRHYLADDFADPESGERFAKEIVAETRKWIAQLKKSGKFDEVNARPGPPLPKSEKDYAQLLQQEMQNCTGWPADEFIELVMDLTSPVNDGWAEEGGLEGAEIRELPGRLSCSYMITQTRRTHWQIAELLADLRAIQNPEAKKLGRPPQKHDFISNKPSEHVLQQLERKIDHLDFLAETPLAEVTQALTKEMGVPVIIDVQGLEEDGLEVADVKTRHDSPMSQSAAEVLDCLASDNDLCWYVMRDVIIVTTETAGESFLQTTVFDITSLYDKPGQNSDGDTLLEMIMTCAAVPTPGWAEDGGLEGAECDIVFVNGINALVIRQTPKATRHVEEILARLYRSGHKFPDDEQEIQSWSPYYGNFGGGMSGGMEGSGNGMGGMGGGGGGMF